MSKLSKYFIIFTKIKGMMHAIIDDTAALRMNPINGITIACGFFFIFNIKLLIYDEIVCIMVVVLLSSDCRVQKIWLIKQIEIIR